MLVRLALACDQAHRTYLKARELFGSDSPITQCFLSRWLALRDFQQSLLD